MKDGLKAEREEHQLFDVTMEREVEKSLPEQQARPLFATKRGSDSASLTSLCPIASVCPIYIMGIGTFSSSLPLIIG